MDERNALDERIKMKDGLLKTVAKSWFAFQAALDQTPEAARTQHDALLAALREYEFFQQRFEDVAARNEAQLEACESLVKSRKIEVDGARERNRELKAQYLQALQARRHYEEYEKLAELISKYPSREETEATVAQLHRDIAALERRKQELDTQLAVRTGQFQHVLHAVRSLSVALNTGADTAPPPGIVHHHAHQAQQQTSQQQQPAQQLEDGEL